MTAAALERRIVTSSAARPATLHVPAVPPGRGGWMYTACGKYLPADRAAGAGEAATCRACLGAA